ncbi:hypothetical protein HDU97_003988 [Phlyctochytrium planicorne]|nr:hypothetical protein HDU97_003988 [Phlyctochytrium planicorne]
MAPSHIITAVIVGWSAIASVSGSYIQVNNDVAGLGYGGRCLQCSRTISKIAISVTHQAHISITATLFLAITIAVPLTLAISIAKSVTFSISDPKLIVNSSCHFTTTNACTIK